MAKKKSNTPKLPIKEAVERMWRNNVLARTWAESEELPTAEQAELPRAWRTLGYTGVARVMGVTSGAIRHYWAADCERGFSQSLPAPDILLERIAVTGNGEEVVEILPGWTEETIRDWMPYRVGAGNHTSNDSPTGRKGFNEGRRNWTRARSDAADTPDEQENAVVGATS